jgi:hypothetical protein
MAPDFMLVRGRYKNIVAAFPINANRILKFPQTLQN